MKYLKDFNESKKINDIIQNVEDILLELSEEDSILKSTVKSKVTFCSELIIIDFRIDEELYDNDSTIFYTPTPLMIDTIDRLIDYMKSEGFDKWYINLMELNNGEYRKLEKDDLEEIDIYGYEVVTICFGFEYRRN